MFIANRQGWIGVDIGTHAVKLAQLERRGTGYALTDAAVIQRLEPWKAVDGLARRPRRSSDELTAARSLGPCFSGRRTAGMLPMAVCQLRSLPVPQMDDTQRRDFIARELGLAQGDERMEFDFWTSHSDREAQTIVRDNVTVLSLPRCWADQFVSDHEAANLTCHVLDGLPLTLARAVRLTHPDSEPIAAVDWGFSRATFCLIVDGRPVVTRCLRGAGFDGVLRRLRSTLEVNWDEARQVAREYGTGGREAGVESHELTRLVHDILTPSLQTLCDELRRTIDYIGAHRPAIRPDRMLLFGGGATLAGIDRWLSQQLQLVVEPWQLGAASFRNPLDIEIPTVMLGPAIALSALAWEEQS